MNDLTHRAGLPTSKLQTQLDYILLDGSGSMQSKWWESLTAIDAYIDGLKAENLNSQITIQVFDDSNIDSVQRDVPLGQWIPLNTNPIGAYWGGTPLYDAINVMGRKFKVLDPARASALIVTDGDENGSTYTTLDQAKAILDWMRAKGWQVTFIGAEFNNARSAALLGGNRQSAIGVQKKLLTEAARNLAKKRLRYGLYGEPMHFTEGEHTQFGGYLEALGGGSNGDGR
jgi:hypothetical protein